MEAGEGVGDAGFGHADNRPDQVGVEAEAEGGKLVGVGELGEDAAGEGDDREEGVVGVGRVVLAELTTGGGWVAAGLLVVGVEVGAEDAAQVLEGLLGAELGVEEVEDGEVDEGVPAGEGDAEAGGVGAEHHEVVGDVLADEHVGVVEPLNEDAFGLEGGSRLIELEHHRLEGEELGEVGGGEGKVHRWRGRR